MREHFGLVEPILPIRPDGNAVFAEPAPFHSVELRNGLRVTIIAAAEGSARPELKRWSGLRGVPRIEAAARSPDNERTDVAVVEPIGRG